MLLILKHNFSLKSTTPRDQRDGSPCTRILLLFGSDALEREWVSERARERCPRECDPLSVSFETRRKPGWRNLEGIQRSISVSGGATWKMATLDNGVHQEFEQWRIHLRKQGEMILVGGGIFWIASTLSYFEISILSASCILKERDYNKPITVIHFHSNQNISARYIS